MITKNHLPAYGITLADGMCWKIIADKPETESFVERLANVMMLRVSNFDGCQFLVKVRDRCNLGSTNSSWEDTRNSSFARLLSEYPWQGDPLQRGKSISYYFPQEDGNNTSMLPIMQLSSLIALDAMSRGGMLVHGALIVRDGMGVILAGPSGVGKTTACSRLPDTWRSLSDDTTLIVRDPSGDYWAHPWPTWSRFFFGGEGGSWDVGTSVQLKAICFLSQSSELDLVLLGEGEMACLSMDTVEQACIPITREISGEDLQKLNTLLFKNICQMVKTVSGCRLNLDLISPFYEWIEDRFLRTES